MDIKMLVSNVVVMLLDSVDDEKGKEFIDKLLDAAEDYVEGTENEWDDAVVNALISKIRSMFDIPDNDE